MSTPVKLKARGLAASLIEHVPSGGVRPLALPPAGSGLEPLMGDPGMPVVGRTLEFLHDGLRHARRYHEQFGTVFWLNALGGRWVQVLGPDGLETVLTNRDRAFSNKLGWDPLIGAFFDRGVMLMDFEEHRHHRRIMQQAFKRDRLVGYLEKMNPAIERGIARWQAGSGFQLYRAAKQLTLDIATEVFVGAERSAEADRLNAAFIAVVVGGQAIIRADVPGGKWHRGLERRRELEQYFRSQLPAKRASEDDDLFSVLCHAETEDGERFSDEDVVNHMIFTMMAAHDTSTITLTMMGYYLARHPEWQDRLRAESQALGKGAIGYERPRRAALDGPRVQGNAAHERARGQACSPAVKDTEIDAHYIPRWRQADARDLPHPANGAVVAEPRQLRSRTLQRRSPRRREPQIRLGRHSEAGYTNASVCTSARWKSKRSCTNCCCATPGRSRPAMSPSSTTAPAHSPATACRSSYDRCIASVARRRGRRTLTRGRGRGR